MTALSAGEKAQLIQWVARDLGGFPGIESTQGVCGGEPCIACTFDRDFADQAAQSIPLLAALPGSLTKLFA